MKLSKAGVFQRLIIAFVLLVVGMQFGARAAQDVIGRVVAIADGDTLTVLTTAQQQVRIRLAEIDTPEAAQPYGTRARQELSELTFGKEVRVTVQDTDRYGRTVGRVHAGGQDVNAEMVRRGAAWVYRQHSRDASLLAVEAEARVAQRGLWALAEAQRVPPWEWRAAGAAGRDQDRQQVAQAIPPPARSSSAPSSRSNSSEFTCGTKRLCTRMTSCAEARFHFEQCGLSRLDGDHDGIPCERLCR